MEYFSSNRVSLDKTGGIQKEDDENADQKDRRKINVAMRKLVTDQFRRPRVIVVIVVVGVLLPFVCKPIVSGFADPRLGLARKSVAERARARAFTHSGSSREAKRK